MLYHSRLGQGEPLLILHGLFGSSRNWHSLSRRYAEHFEVFAVDLRNHGQSFHAPEMDYPSMANDVMELMDHLGLQKSRVIGHSMGGKVTMQLAIDYPDLLKRIVVADIAPVNYRHDHNVILNALMAIDTGRIGSRAEAEDQLQAHIPEASLRAFLLQNLVRKDDRWLWRINLQAIHAHMADLTAFDLPDTVRIQVPSLFIYGARSDYVGDAGQAVIRRQFSQSSLQAVEGAGHWLHAEKPDVFLQSTLTYLGA